MYFIAASQCELMVFLILVPIPTSTGNIYGIESIQLLKLILLAFNSINNIFIKPLGLRNIKK